MRGQGKHRKPLMKNCVRWLGLILFLASITFSGAQPSSNEHGTTGKEDRGASQATTKQAVPEVPAYHRSEKEAKPFPALLPASQFQKYPVIARAYEIAHEIPGVLAQQPCYCRCDKRFGHSSLLDCYASTHTAGCMTCLRETYFAYQMTKQGKKPAEIRAAIIRGDWREANLN